MDKHCRRSQIKGKISEWLTTRPRPLSGSPWTRTGVCCDVGLLLASGKDDAGCEIPVRLLVIHPSIPSSAEDSTRSSKHTRERSHLTHRAVGNSRIPSAAQLSTSGLPAWCIDSLIAIQPVCSNAHGGPPTSSLRRAEYDLPAPNAIPPQARPQIVI